MPVTNNGAQRASSRPRIVLAAVGVALGFLVTVGPLSASAATAPWLSVETYYLKLLNCTRTGGWVVSTGATGWYCRGGVSSYVRPIALSTNLSNLVSRPYAKLLAVGAQCTHYLGGTTPRTRFNKVGYAWLTTWGENIGCRDGYSNAYQAVKASHLVFQSEKSYGGGHWKNMRNSRFKWVGIGVWVASGRTRLVTDFGGY